MIPGAPFLIYKALVCADRENNPVQIPTEPDNLSFRATVLGKIQELPTLDVVFGKLHHLTKSYQYTNHHWGFFYASYHIFRMLGAVQLTGICQWMRYLLAWCSVAPPQSVLHGNYAPLPPPPSLCGNTEWRTGGCANRTAGKRKHVHLLNVKRPTDAPQPQT